MFLNMLLFSAGIQAAHLKNGSDIPSEFPAVLLESDGINWAGSTSGNSPETLHLGSFSGPVPFVISQEILLAPEVYRSYILHNKFLHFNISIPFYKYSLRDLTEGG